MMVDHTKRVAEIREALAALPPGRVPPPCFDGLGCIRELLAAYDALRTMVQMCCDGTSEDDPAQLCAATVQRLMDDRDQAWRDAVVAMGRTSMPSGVHARIESYRQQLKEQDNE